MNKNYLFLMLLSILCLSLLILNASKELESEKIEITVAGFTEDSTLKTAGAQIGDILLRYEGKAIPDIKTLGDLKSGVKTDTVMLELLRNGELIKFEIPAGQLGVFLREFYPDHKFDEEAVIIDGIEKLDWGIGMENSFLAALTRIDEKFGYGLTYQDLVGLSAYGFRIHFYDGWCPSSPDATCGWDCGAYILNALGYDFEVYLLDEFAEKEYEEFSLDKESMIKKIVGSIDSGWPVIAIDLIRVPEWGIITGYQDKGNGLICRTYYDKTRGYDLAEKFPWVIYIIKNRTVVDLKPLYLQSLKQAKKLYNQEDYKNYFSGIKAIEEWINALSNEQTFQEMEPEKYQEVQLANWWIYYSLWDARGYTIQYLKDNTGNFSIREKNIQQLISLYAQETKLLKAGFDFVPNPHENKAENWTPELRIEQINTLKKILEFERKVNLILLTL